MDGDPIRQANAELDGIAGNPGLHPVASANPKSPGVAPASLLSVELAQALAVQGSTLLENPATVTLSDGTSVVIDHYGYMGPGPMVALPGTNVEAQKTEPDKNTYLV